MDITLCTKLSIAIILLLVIILSLKLFLESSYAKWLYNSKEEMSSLEEIENKMKKEIEKIKIITKNKINNAVEQGYKEGFRDMIQDDDIVSYLNKTNKVKLQLFYKKTCSHCSEFLPVWYKIINNISNTVIYEEIECDTNPEVARLNNITSVPTVILLVNNEKKIYIGDRTYNDLSRFLKINGVNLVERTFEDFASTGYTNDPVPTPALNRNCPAVTFDKDLDIVADKYMFQIFNANGQYGYAVGGNKEGKLLTPFTAAYSVVDSYLSSLPNPNDPSVSLYENATECANLYSNEIRSFGLCDEEKLNEILNYQKSIDDGTNEKRIENTNYDTNTQIVKAIKNACQI
jgi:thiol-disulfide isomerase/thioredoxin